VTTLAVWAPRASRVEAVVDGAPRPMKAADGGWWRAEVDAGAGCAYGFSLDGADPLPDPRSAWQPDGVHALGRLVDHGAFEWQTASWQGRELLGSVLYELHIGTFTEQGTFDAAIAHLGHLVELGVDFVEIMPVAAFPGRRNWGYDGVFPYAVQESYGGPDGMKRFVDACHGHGLGVLLDVVYNHLGPDGNVLAKYGPYFTDGHTTPWGDAINYSGADSDEVRRYFLDNAAMWLREYRLDGLRLDAVHAILDTSATHFLEELSAATAALSEQLGRPLTIFAESDLNDPRVIEPGWAGGYACDAQWNDDFHHALHAVLTGETFGYYEDFGSLTDVGAAFAHGFVYTGQRSRHRRRRHGRPLPASVSARQLLAYSQSHDQVGNRARGERLAALVSPALLKVAAALVLTSPFTPMLFMGEEWAASTPWQYFTDHDDVALVESIRTGRRREFESFGWLPEEIPDPQDPQTARGSVLDWAELDDPAHRDMLRWYRDLIALRRTNADLREGGFGGLDVAVDEVARVLTIARGSTVVVANLSPERRHLTTTARRVLLASAPATVAEDGVTVAGESVVILDGSDAGGDGLVD